MKILFLNPYIDAEHHIVSMIQEKGHAVLVAGYPEEAWHLLQIHGTTVDIAVVHKEGKGPEEESLGFSFITRFKGDLNHSDLPFVITSEIWGDQEFARHQQTSMGANGYLRWPATAENIFRIVQEVLGSSQASSAFSGANIENDGVHLEDSKLIFADIKEKNKTSSDSPAIVLEAPPDEVTKIPEKSKTIPTAMFVQDVPDLLPLPSLPTPEEPDVEFGSPTAKEEVQLATRNISLDLNPASADAGIDLGVDVAVDVGGKTDATVPIRQSEVRLDAQEINFNPSAEKEPEIKNKNEIENEPEKDVMPYLFQRGSQGRKENSLSRESSGLAFALAQAVGDAVVPGGAVQSPDVETLKKYLLLREQDVAVLSSQLKTVKEQVASLDRLLQEEKSKNIELAHQNETQKRKIDHFEQEKVSLSEGLQAELNELKYQMKTKADKARLLETQVKEAAEETDKIRERVKSDIRKIRVREKELENRLEILKKDSESLVTSRENKIIELKRKIDLLEFNMDLLQDQYMREKEKTVKLKERLSRAAQVVRVAGGLLDSTTHASDGANQIPEDKRRQEAS